MVEDESAKNSTFSSQVVLKSLSQPFEFSFPDVHKSSQSIPRFNTNTLHNISLLDS